MTRAIEILAVIQFVVIGSSHIVARHGWVDFYLWLRDKGTAGVFANGFLSLSAGALFVAFHPVWSGIPLALTVFGILNVAKAGQCFLLPAIGMRSMQRVSHERAHEFAVMGGVLLGLAAVLTFHLVRTA